MNSQRGLFWWRQKGLEGGCGPGDGVRRWSGVNHEGPLILMLSQGAVHGPPEIYILMVEPENVMWQKRLCICD